MTDYIAVMDTRQRQHITTFVSALLTLILTSHAPLALAQPASPATQTPVEQLDDATREAVDLEDRIAELEAERIAIETRLDVLDERIQAQLLRLDEAREKLRDARNAYSERVVSIYKHGTASAFFMLLEAASLEDLLARTALVSRIANSDKALWERAAEYAADEHYQASVLEDLRAQEDELRDINESRRRTLEGNLAHQRTIVARLSEEATAYLLELRARQARTRKDWENSSIPLDSTLAFVDATVEPHDDRTYLVPSYQPRHYVSTGKTDVMVCSWYGNEFHGRRTASGQIFNENDFTCASRTLAFGTRLALSRADRRIIVVVTDRGPFISGRDLDLSKAAAAALGFSGVEPVHVEFVEAAAD